MRKKLLEFRAQLRGQGFVMGQHQCGPLDLFNDLGHREGLTGPGNPQQGLFLQPVVQAHGQGLNGLGLVPGGGIVADNFKFGHGPHLARTDILPKRKFDCKP